MKTRTVSNSRFFGAAILPLVLSLAMISHVGAETIVIPAASSQANVKGTSTDTKASETEVSVLERFSTYSAQRTVEELTALFSLPQSTVVRQLPAIAISDGRTAVLIAARIAPKDGRAINFSLEGATLISIRKIKTDEWEIKALPDKGAVAMSLLVMDGADTITYPLTVAPPLPPTTDLSIQGFQEFIEQRDGSGQSGKDLNGDGRHDYLDDYIYTANYLAKQRATGRDKSARQQRALKRTLAVEPAPIKPEFDPKDFPD